MVKEGIFWLLLFENGILSKMVFQSGILSKVEYQDSFSGSQKLEAITSYCSAMQRAPILGAKYRHIFLVLMQLVVPILLHQKILVRILS